VTRYRCVLAEIEYEVQADSDLAAQEQAFAKAVRDLRPQDFWVLREKEQADGTVQPR